MAGYLGAMLHYGSFIITGIAFTLIYHNIVYFIYVLQAIPLNNVIE